ncbi:MAG: TIGR03936 family radical SAM-associated protein [Lachnospirales bacterium]
MIKYRLKFSKRGRIRFIGHLDLLTVMQRAVNRASLPISYSNGFNPHQIMSFALPLALGFSSIGEYLDIQLNEEINEVDVRNRLNVVLPEGIEILKCKLMPNNTKNSASTLYSATYDVKIYGIDNIEDFINEKEIIVMKKTKKQLKETDIKKSILNISYDETLHLKLLTGSQNNLKADLVVNSIYDYYKVEYDIDKIEFLRTEMFDENNKTLL